MIINKLSNQQQTNKTPTQHQQSTTTQQQINSKSTRQSLALLLNSFRVHLRRHDDSGTAASLAVPEVWEHSALPS